MNKIFKSEFYKDVVLLTEKLKAFCKIEYEGYDPIVSAWKYMIRNRTRITTSENAFGTMMKPGDLVFIQGSHRFASVGVYLFSKDGFDKILSFASGTSRPIFSKERSYIYFDAFGSLSHCLPLHIEDIGKNQDQDDKKEEIIELMLETSELIKKIIVIHEP